MRSAKRLGRIQKSSLRALDRLVKETEALVRSPRSRDRDRRIGLVTIDSANLWTQFTRVFFISCALGTQRVHGGRISPPIPFSNESQALGAVIPLFKPRATPLSTGHWHRRDEPAWHDPRVALRCFTHISASNLADVQAGLSSGSTVLDHLPVFRNFFAHRNGQTEAAAKVIGPSYGIPAVYRPSQILATRPLGRPNTLLEDWLDDLRLMIEFLCY